MIARLLLPIALLSLVAAASAQTEAPSQKPERFQLYGGYTFLSNSFNGELGEHHALSGWDSSFVGFPAWRNLCFKLDMFGYVGSNTGGSQNSIFVLGGPQYFHRFGREIGFVEAMAGDGRLARYWGPNGAPGETASFSAVIGGGVDTPISPRLAIRVAGGFQWAHFGLLESITNQVPIYHTPLPRSFGRIASGLVWRF